MTSPVIDLLNTGCLSLVVSNDRQTRVGEEHKSRFDRQTLQGQKNEGVKDYHFVFLRASYLCLALTLCKHSEIAQSFCSVHDPKTNVVFAQRI